MANATEPLVRMSLDIKKLKSAVVFQRSYEDRVSVAMCIRILTTVPDEVPYIVDELDFLEGLRIHSITKPDSGFKSAQMTSFRKKHFFAARHFIKNIGVRWSLDRNGNRDFEKMLTQVADDFGQDPILWPAKLVHRLVLDGFTDRIGRLTGDWIIFAEKDGVRYYLDLALHSEGFDSGTLYKKLRDGNISEFPFLFE